VTARFSGRPLWPDGARVPGAGIVGQQARRGLARDVREVCLSDPPRTTW